MPDSPAKLPATRLEMHSLEPIGDPLFDLQSRIARRADELSHERSASTRYPLINWLEAEWEILRDHALFRDAAALRGSVVSREQQGRARSAA